MWVWFTTRIIVGVIHDTYKCGCGSQHVDLWVWFTTRRIVGVVHDTYNCVCGSYRMYVECTTPGSVHTGPMTVVVH